MSDYRIQACTTHAIPVRRCDAKMHSYAIREDNDSKAVKSLCSLYTRAQQDKEHQEV